MKPEDIHISVIVPTCGRPTLLNTVKSIACQLGRHDELIVIHDGPTPLGAPPWDMTLMAGKSIRYDETSTQTKNSGASQRDLGMSIAHGTHFMFCDDDDVFAPMALALARDWAVAHPTRPLIFQMAYNDGRAVLWSRKAVEPGNVGTPMFVVPRTDSLPLWSDFDHVVNLHDFHWITTVVSRLGDPVWIDKVISYIRPKA